MISGRMGLWLAAQQAVLRQQLQPLAAKPGSGYFKDRSAGRALLMRDKLKKENVKKWCKIALKM